MIEHPALPVVTSPRGSSLSLLSCAVQLSQYRFVKALPSEETVVAWQRRQAAQKAGVKVSKSRFVTVVLSYLMSVLPFWHVISVLFNASEAPFSCTVNANAHALALPQLLGTSLRVQINPNGCARAQTLSESSCTERTGRITRSLVRAAEKLGTAEETYVTSGARSGSSMGGAVSQQTQQVMRCYRLMSHFPVACRARKTCVSRILP